MHIKCGQKQVTLIEDSQLFYLPISNQSCIENYANENNNDQQITKVLN